MDAATSAEPFEARMPTISERLRTMQPSHELLAFYRQKIQEFDGEHADMLQKLERYKGTFGDQHKQAWSLAQREEEIRQLQKALSDMQVHLFQEREHVLRLYAENDRLKILELEDRKKIQHLLGLTQPVEQETTYFRGENQPELVGAQGAAAVIMQQENRRGRGKRPAAKNGAADARPRDSAFTKQVKLGDKDRIETLLLTVEALQAQMEDNTRVSKEREAALLEDRRVREEEYRAETTRDTERLQDLTDKLHHTQDLLYDSTRDYLELKYDHRSTERGWAEEKERLLGRIEEVKTDMDDQYKEMNAALEEARMPSEPSFDATRDYRDVGTNAYRSGWKRDERSSEKGGSSSKASSCDAAEAAQTQRDKDRESMAEMYRAQCMELEDELCRIREEKQASKDVHSDRNKKLLKRLGLMKKRYEQLETRRQLEAEGYKNSIKLSSSCGKN